MAPSYPGLYKVISVVMRIYDAILIPGPFSPCCILVLYGPLNLHIVLYLSIAWSHDPFLRLLLEVLCLGCFSIIHVLDSHAEGCHSAILGLEVYFLHGVYKYVIYYGVINPTIH